MLDEFRTSFGIHEEAWMLFVQGYEAQMEGRIDVALMRYQKSVELHPTAEAYTFLGWALSFLERYDEAIDSCERAIKTDPDFGNPYNDIGSYLVAQGLLEEAIPWFERAIEAPRYEPRHFPHCNLGVLYEKLGRFGEAIAAFRKALQIEPGYVTATQHLRRLMAFHN